MKKMLLFIGLKIFEIGGTIGITLSLGWLACKFRYVNEYFCGWDGICSIKNYWDAGCTVVLGPIILVALVIVMVWLNIGLVNDILKK